MASLCSILLLSVSVISIFFLLAADCSTVPQHSNDSTEVTISTQPNVPIKSPPSDIRRILSTIRNSEELREGTIEKLEKVKVQRKVKIEADKVIVTHYLLVLQWPPSVCNSDKNKGKTCIKPIPQDFKVHGLWPQGEAGSLGKCVPSKANEFNSGKVFRVKDLVKVWPQLFKGKHNNPTLDTVEFWKYEWEEHGACSGMNPVDYFEKTVKLYDTLKLKILLDNNNVKPGNMYAPQRDIINMLPLPLTPKVTCGANTTGQFEIQEFSFNVTATADNFQPITVAIKVSYCPDGGNNPVGFR